MTPFMTPYFTPSFLRRLAKVSKLSAIASATSLLLASCGGGGDEATTASTPTVTYSTSFSETDVAKYKSADWLFQNYFGEYGLPAELKTMMMPEMMMLANGFALQQSRGDNVQEAIAQFNTAMRVMYYSGQINTAMQKMVVQNEEGLFKPAKESLIPLSAEPVEPREIDAQAQNNIAQAEQLEAEFVREQEQLVVDHNLPYTLPEQTIKYVIYNQAMKGGGRGKNGGTRPSPAPVTNKWTPIQSWQWWNADFAWVDGAAGIGHMGLIDIDAINLVPGQKHIIDSNTGPGVKRHFNIAEWMKLGGWSRIEAHQYRHYNRDDFRRRLAVRYANSLIGKPYNWNFWDKTATDATYCSQLIWSSYRAISIDLDSTGGAIVYPRDLTRHRDVRMWQSMS